MPFIWHALPPEVNVGNLLYGGPGVGTITSAAESYLATASSLMTAAAGTSNAMGNMGETWNGMSADKAQEAFQNHTNWLNQQAMVAQEVSAVLNFVAAEFGAAQGVMAAVEVELIANLTARSVLIATSPISNNGALLAANLIEYFLVIWPAAAAVMDAYEGMVVPTLAAMPPPVPAMPLISGDPGLPFDPPKFDVPAPQTKSTTQSHLDNTTNNTTTDNTKTNTDTNNTGNDKPGDTDPGNSKTDPGTNQTDPTQTATQQPTADPTDQLSSMNNPGQSPNLDGTGGSALDQSTLGLSNNSSTLAGMSGGAGSLVALNMVRGGLGSLPGASTGFRMPSSWLRGPGTAFGASNQPTTGPGARGAGPRRGASAPRAQMRRRRKDEDRKSEKVFVPGEQLEVPVLEKPPVIGVIEYADSERPDDAVPEEALLVGVLQSTEDDVAVGRPEPAR